MIRPTKYPYDYQINNLEAFSTLSKKHFRVFAKITVNYPIEGPIQNKKKDFKMQTNLAKLSKKIKSLNTVNLKDYLLKPEHTKNSHNNYIAKRFSRIKNLIIPNISPSWTTPLKKSGLEVRGWLRYVKQLTKLDYFSSERYFSFSRKITYWTLKNLKYQKKIQLLQIQLPSESFTSEPAFWKLCSRKSVKTLAINGGQFSLAATPKIQNIESISFIFDSRQNVDFLNSAIQLTTQLYRLQELNLTFDHEEIPTENSDYILLSQLKELKKVNFKFYSEENNHNSKCKGYANYIKAIENLPLTHLGLGISIHNDKQLAPISDILRKMKLLESIILKVTSDYTFQENGELRNLIQGIGKSKNLKSLDLTLKTAVRVFQRETFSDALVEKILGILASLKHLENLYIFSNQFDPNKIFIELLQTLSRQASTLKSLELFLGKYDPVDNSKFYKVLDALKAFQQIRKLKLYSLYIHENEQFEELGAAIKTLERLADFAIGKINKKLGKLEIAQGLEHILSKNCLIGFDWKVSRNFIHTYSAREIKVSDLARINPSLKEYPKDLLRILNKNFAYEEESDADEFNSQILDDDDIDEDQDLNL